MSKYSYYSSRGQRIPLHEIDLRHREHWGIQDHEVLDENGKRVTVPDYDSVSHRVVECLEKDQTILDLSHLKAFNLTPSKLDRLQLDKIQYLFLNDCNLSNISSLAFFSNLEVLDISSNNLDVLPKLPNIKELCCRNNRLMSLERVPPSVIRVDCSYNMISSVPTNLVQLEHLLCHNNLIQTIENLPHLRELDCRHNKIKHISHLPLLDSLDCNENILVSIRKFPHLRYLLCSSNKLEFLDKLPMVENIDCSYNPSLGSLPHFPLLRELTCDYNGLELADGYHPLKTILLKDSNVVHIFF